MQFRERSRSTPNRIVRCTGWVFAALGAIGICSALIGHYDTDFAVGNCASASASPAICKDQGIDYTNHTTTEAAFGRLGALNTDSIVATFAGLTAVVLARRSSNTVSSGPTPAARSLEQGYEPLPIRDDIATAQQARQSQEHWPPAGTEGDSLAA